MVRYHDVVVVGGGLAGLAAAFRLSQRGFKVVLLESTSVLGGRTSSWIEKGMPVESGLHRFLGFYRALPKLVKDAGIVLDEMLVWEDEVEIRSHNPDTTAVFALSVLHKPIQTITSLLSNREFLGMKEKAEIISFFAQGMFEAKTDSDRMDRVSIAEYAREKKLHPRLVHTVITPLATGIFFLPPEKYSAYAFFGLLNAGIKTMAKLRVGGFAGGMTEVMADPLGEAIKRRGGEIVTGAAVEKVIIRDKVVKGVVVNGEEVFGKSVILATSLAPAQRILLSSFKASGRLRNFYQLKAMPVVTFQAELRKRALPVDRTTFGPGTVLASFAEQSHTTFPREHAGRISIILADPGKYIDKSDEEINEIVVNDGDKIGVALKNNIERFRVIRLPMDFYSLEPGNDNLRPETRTPVKGLYLAGDYVRQPWFGTMEGAVVSGEMAAACVSR